VSAPEVTVEAPRGAPPSARAPVRGAPRVRPRRRRAPWWRPARRRDLAYYVAIVATGLLVSVAMLEITSRWHDERTAMRRALVSELADAAVLLMDRMTTQRRTADLLLMAPIHGMARAPGERGLPLAHYLRYTEEHLTGMALDGDPLHGVFRIDLRAPWPDAERLEALGATRRPAVAAELLRRLAAREKPGGGVQTSIRRIGLPVGERLAHVVYSRERSADGAALAIVGVMYDPGHWYGRMVQPVLDAVPLLPPAFYGVDWTSAQWTGSAKAGVQPRTVVGHLEARHNGLLALSLTDTRGRTLFHTARADSGVRDVDGGRRRYRASFGHDDLTLHVALPDAHGERLVRAAVPIGPEQWLLGGVALLGALFFAAAIVELRRQHQLAEERRNFVSAVSHELRTPLAHVALLSETLLAPQPHTDEQQRRWLGVIHREALRLGRLVENVLLHARGEQHDLVLDLRPVDACEIAREVLLGLASAARARHAQLRLMGAERCLLRADAGALRQVLLNLVDNAIKHGPDGQTITLRVAGDVTADAVVLTVDDEGPGIPGRERRRVWRPFVRLGDRGGATGGSGLGLSVVRELVVLHQGRVDIQDAPAGGARLVVTLPTGGTA
jgi:signal transduction histidine kinase